MTARHAIRVLTATTLALGLVGCTTTWDDITSRDFKVSSMWTAAPAPMTVIEKSTDGYARAKAFSKLDESSDPQIHERQMRVLQSTAITDRDPLCRLAAIRTLGRYKDPQAAKTLSEVYLGNPGMSPENNALIRQQALTSLQNNSPTEARQLFIQAARQPSGSLTGAAQRDRMEILDERLTAIRALAKYPQPDSVETLVKLLETEKDIAIRTCAHESLKSATKRDIAADGKAWREFLVTGREPERPSSPLLASFTRGASTPTPTPTPTTPSNEPGFFDKIQNFIRPDSGVEPIPTTVPTTPAPEPQLPRPNAPAMLPLTTPGVPAPTAQPIPNQVRHESQPTPTVVPASGTYRNAQGELIVPATP